MKLEIEVQQMLKCLSRDLPDRTLADACEYGVEQFTRKRSSYSSGTIYARSLVDHRWTKTGKGDTHIRESWSQLRSIRLRPLLCRRLARLSQT